MIREGFIRPADSQFTSLLWGEEMSPFFMDTGYKSSSPGSLSAEESHSNTPGSEREGEGQQTGGRGTKRKEANRDAARKSRKKQTERADELHEELQCLERSNSVLQKEIASLKRDLHLYRTALERHEPSCCLRDAASSSGSTTNVPVSPTADCQASSSPPAAPSLTTSLTSSLSLQTLDCVESTYLSSSAPAPTTLASSTGSSPEVFTSSSSLTVPYSVSLSTAPAPHSLFSNDPPLITSRLTNVTPICTSSLTKAAEVNQSRKRAIHDRSSTSANAFSTLDALYAFQTKQASFLTAPSNVVPPYSHVVAENTDLEVQGCAMNVPQLHPGHFRGNPINSSSLLPSALQDPALQSLPVSPQANPEPCPASAFAPRPSYSQHIAPSPASLLSLLTVPTPFNVSQTTSSFDGPQAPPSVPPTGDTSRDLSLSEFLEINDWLWEQ